MSTLAAVHLARTLHAVAEVPGRDTAAPQPGRPEAKSAADRESSAQRECLDPEFSLYRRNTLALLRRYFSMSIELGRLPSVIGREFFRAKVSSYRIHSFEDVVILVHDVDRCLARLDTFEQELVARVVLQDYSHAEAATLLRCTRRTVTRRLPEALDLLTKIFLETGLLRAFGEVRPAGRTAKKASGETCQEPENSDFDVST